MAHKHAFEDYMLTRTNIKKNEMLKFQNDKNKNKHKPNFTLIDTFTENPKWISQCEETSNANILLYFFWKIMKKTDYSDTYECLKDDILKKIDDAAHTSSNLLKKNVRKIHLNGKSKKFDIKNGIEGLDLDLCYPHRSFDRQSMMWGRSRPTRSVDRQR
jgi:uncharacterized protein YdeI (YjbR/CyaY-like superfamily)